MTVGEIEDADVKLASSFFSKVYLQVLDSGRNLTLTRYLVTVLSQPVVFQFLLRLVHSEISLRQPTLTREVTFRSRKMTVTNNVSVEQEVARQKILPFSSYWARNSPYGTPVGALTFHWIFSVILILACEWFLAQALFDLSFGQTC